MSSISRKFPEGKWTCHLCTFINDNNWMGRCLMCFTARPLTSEVLQKHEERQKRLKQIEDDERIARQLQDLYSKTSFSQPAISHTPSKTPVKRPLVLDPEPVSAMIYSSSKKRRLSFDESSQPPAKRRRISEVDEQKESLAEALLSGLKIREQKEEIEQPPALTVTLMTHQRQGVAWALSMEGNRLRRGGMLCDDMGLGKTIQMIALFLSSRTEAKPDKKQRTLVVAPLCVVEQWKQEVERVAPEQFRIFIYHGNDARKVRQGYSLKSYDLILTTYGTIGADYSRSNYGLFRMKKNFFYRMVLDEGHFIVNRSTKRTKAIWELGSKCKARWILTGTPIQNKMEDVYSYGRFLQLQECKTFDSFKWKVLARSERVHAFFSSISLRRMKNDIKGEIPPRSDEVIEANFSELEQEIYSAFEKKAQQSLQQLVDRGIMNKSYATLFGLVMRLRLACGHIYMAIGKNIHEKLEVQDDEKEGESPDDPNWIDPLAELSESIIKRFNQADSSLFEECVICFDELEDGVILKECGHIFCKEHLDGLNGDCPFRCGAFDARACIPLSEAIKSKRVNERAKLRPDDQLEFDEREADDMKQRLAEEARKKLETSEESCESDDIFVSSTKVDMLYERLMRIKEQDPKVKTLVFSSFVKMINICQEKLNRHGFKPLQYVGSMTRSQRNKTLRAFRTRDDHTVMLMSLKCASVGLNLTVASRVIFVDSWWNPSVEEQAIDRVHRIGQTRPVFVERLTIANTVEQRILAMQERKRNLAKAIVDGARAASKAKMGVSELRQLFGI